MATEDLPCYWSLCCFTDLNHVILTLKSALHFCAVLDTDQGSFDRKQLMGWLVLICWEAMVMLK